MENAYFTGTVWCCCRVLTGRYAATSHTHPKANAGGLAGLGGVFGARGGGLGGAFANVVGEAIAQREAADGRQTYMVRNA